MSIDNRSSGPSSKLEIERKFLVKNNDWQQRGHSRAYHIRQGYLSGTEAMTVRIRRIDDSAFLTIKAAYDKISRYEFEYAIPVADAETMLHSLCTAAPVEKTRYEVVDNGNTWEIDVFEGENNGLIIAEIELTSPDQSFFCPSWLGPEVSHDPRFFNARLYHAPFRKWGVDYHDLVALFHNQVRTRDFGPSTPD